MPTHFSSLGLKISPKSLAIRYCAALLMYLLPPEGIWWHIWQRLSVLCMITSMLRPSLSPYALRVEAFCFSVHWKRIETRWEADGIAGNPFDCM